MTQALSSRRRWLALPAVLIATFMAQFDLFVVNVALPVLQRQLNAGDAALQLIVGGYAFVYAAGLVTAGRLGDRIGHRTVFLLGMGAFGLTSLWCGLAQSPLELVIARQVQGLAGAAMVPQVLALISLLFAPHERARALSVFGVVIGVGSVAGQVLGGVIINADLFGSGGGRSSWSTCRSRPSVSSRGQRSCRDTRRPRIRVSTSWVRSVSRSGSLLSSCRSPSGVTSAGRGGHG